MKTFFKELRRREVFRTAGLYVGICWILIEGGSVVLPAFGAPDWLLRGAIVVAMAGFPVMLVLAWFFDVNEEGISLQGEPASRAPERSGVRKTDFAVMAILALALIVSLYLNVSKDAPVDVEQEPLAVLVADFQTSVDAALFDLVLEEALLVGLEVAPHISAFNRQGALRIGNRTDRDADATEPARELAQHAGIDLLLAGSLLQSGSGYQLTIDGLDVADGRVMFTVKDKAASRDAVLPALGELADKLRRELGDRTRRERRETDASHVLAASLEAAHAYASGRQAERAEKLEDAAQFYAQAVEADPKLGRAFSRLALVEFALGRTDTAQTHRTQALSLANTLTERERLRALGHYSDRVVMDGDKALEIYAEFVDQYPADLDARDRYASVLFRQLDFAAAIKQLQRILQVLPDDQHTRTRLALYAMYAGEWDTAIDEAGKVSAAAPTIATAYLPVAMSALSRGEIDIARDTYRQMASTGQDGSLAELGLADIDLYLGQFDAAQQRLSTSIDADIAAGEPRLAALKTIALAQARVEQGDLSAATAAVTDALLLANDDAVRVPAAMIYIQADELAAATTIANDLAQESDAHSRAYGRMLTGMLLEKSGAGNDAIFTMREAIRTAELWLIRFETGKAYLRAGNYPEALDELMALKLRRSEATAVFLNDMPTYRVLAELPYWIGRVQEQLKIRPAARASYAEYLALRPNGGALAEDASARALALQEP